MFFFLPIFLSMLDAEVVSLSLSLSHCLSLTLPEFSTANFSCCFNLWVKQIV